MSEPMDERGFSEFLEEAMRPGKGPKWLLVFCPECQDWVGVGRLKKEEGEFSKCPHELRIVEDTAEQAKRAWQKTIYDLMTPTPGEHHRWQCACGTCVVEVVTWTDGTFDEVDRFIRDSNKAGHYRSRCYES